MVFMARHAKYKYFRNSANQQTEPAFTIHKWLRPLPILFAVPPTHARDVLPGCYIWRAGGALARGADPKLIFVGTISATEVG